MTRALSALALAATLLASSGCATSGFARCAFREVRWQACERVNVDFDASPWSRRASFDRTSEVCELNANPDDCTLRRFEPISGWSARHERLVGDAARALDFDPEHVLGAFEGDPISGVGEEWPETEFAGRNDHDMPWRNGDGPRIVLFVETSSERFVAIRDGRGTWKRCAVSHWGYESGNVPLAVGLGVLATPVLAGAVAFDVVTFPVQLAVWVATRSERERDVD